MNEQFKNNILRKSDIVRRQYLLTWKEIENNKHIWNETKESLKHYYTERIPQIIEEFFSNNKELQEEGLKGYRGLLLLRPWDNIDDTFKKNNEKKDKYKDSFVDDFNNFSEFYEFLEDLVKDIEEYHKMRNI
jgi:hypothetical protein